jgi:hypothetical protein
MDWLDTLSRFWPHLVAGLDFVAVLLASIHALLHKRDSRAATLWLGVIWLLPVLGPILYLALGFNRIRRRAISLGVHNTISRPIPDNLGEPKHPGAEHLQMLARVVGRVVAQPVTPGNAIQPLVNGDEAFPAMLAAIECAKTSISLRRAHSVCHLSALVATRTLAGGHVGRPGVTRTRGAYQYTHVVVPEPILHRPHLLKVSIVHPFGGLLLHSLHAQGH